MNTFDPRTKTVAQMRALLQAKYPASQGYPLFSGWKKQELFDALTGKKKVEKKRTAGKGTKPKYMTKPQLAREIEKKYNFPKYHVQERTFLKRDLEDFLAGRKPFKAKGKPQGAKMTIAQIQNKLRKLNIPFKKNQKKQYYINLLMAQKDQKDKKDQGKGKESPIKTPPRKSPPKKSPPKNGNKGKRFIDIIMQRTKLIENSILLYFDKGYYFYIYTSNKPKQGYFVSFSDMSVLPINGKLSRIALYREPTKFETFVGIDNATGRAFLDGAFGGFDGFNFGGFGFNGFGGFGNQGGFNNGNNNSNTNNNKNGGKKQSPPKATFYGVAGPDILAKFGIFTRKDYLNYVKTHHPDRNPNMTKQAMDELGIVNQAYENSKWDAKQNKFLADKQTYVPLVKTPPRRNY